MIIAVVWMRSRNRVVSEISVAELGTHICHPLGVQFYALPAILIGQITTGIGLEAVFWADIVGTCKNLHAPTHAVVDAGDWITVAIIIAAGRGGGRQLIVSSCRRLSMLVASRFAQVSSFESKVGKVPDAVLTTANCSSRAFENCIQQFPYGARRWGRSVFPTAFLAAVGREVVFVADPTILGQHQYRRCCCRKLMVETPPTKTSLLVGQQALRLFVVNVVLYRYIFSSILQLVLFQAGGIDQFRQSGSSQQTQNQGVPVMHRANVRGERAVWLGVGIRTTSS